MNGKKKGWLIAIGVILVVVLLTTIFRLEIREFVDKLYDMVGHSEWIPKLPE